jgi:uncharacterized membrane protein YvbJ
MLATIGGVISLILLIVSKWLEANAEDKKKKEAIIKELKDAIKNGDTSAITAALGGLR